MRICCGVKVIDMVQVPCKGEIGRRAPVARACGPLLRSVRCGEQPPATDAEQTLDPVHPLPQGPLGRLRAAVNRHQATADRVVPRDEIAAGAGADQRGFGIPCGFGKSVADTEGIGGRVDHGGSWIKVVRSVARWIGHQPEAA
jgi:hypothetical protein